VGGFLFSLSVCSYSQRAERAGEVSVACCTKEKGVAMKSRKRRLFPVVDRSLQYRFLAMILAYGFVIVLVMALFLLVPDIVKLVDESLSLEVRAAAADKILTLHSRIWPAIIALVCVLGIHSFLVFHRLIGPLYRFRWAFGRVQKGELNFRVKLRDKDYLHEEEKGFNEMMSVLAEKLGLVQLAGLDALKSLGEVEQRMTEKGGWNESDRELLLLHRQHLETLANAAQYFRLQEIEGDPQKSSEQSDS
jgi:hypothetical protein